MTKKILFFLLIMLSLVVQGEENNLSGKILREHQNQHNGIKIILRSDKEEILAQTKTIFTGYFCFENIKEGKYILDISDSDNGIERAEVYKKGGNFDIGSIKISTGPFYGIYIFSNIILLITILLNVVMIYFIVKSKEKKGAKFILSAVGLSSFWFIFEFIRFIIGINDEITAANLWAISNIGSAFIGLLTMMYILEMFTPNLNKAVGIAFKLILIFLITVLTGMFLWIYMPQEKFIINDLKSKSDIFMFFFYLENIVFFIIGGVVLIQNMITDKDEHKRKISWMLLKRILTTAGLLVFLIIMVSLYSINEVYDGFYKTVFSIMEITLFWAIVKSGFVEDNDEHMSISAIIEEVLKYFIIMLAVFVMINFIEIEGKEYIPIYFGVFVILKVIIDLYAKVKRV